MPSPSSSFPRYTTFKPGELEKRLHEMAPGQVPCPELSAELAAAAFPARPGRLLKEHCCTVTYPDGREGACRYERLGPACHRFGFTNSEDGAFVSREYWTRPLQNTRPAIEEKAKEMAAVAFTSAMERERKEYFCRASEGAGRVKHPERYQMTAERAKQMAGKYALCQPVGSALVPVSAAFASLEAANAAWKARGDTRLVVACCCRLDRCWERPRYNPLYRQYPDMAPRNTATNAAGNTVPSTAPNIARGDTP